MLFENLIKMKMKLMLFIYLLILIPAVYAQQGINYKAIVSDADGKILTNSTITVQFTILENGTTNMYSESHNPTTDDNGIIIVNIGEGTIISGNFDAIDWGNQNFLKTEMNTGNGLINTGITEFKVVPYALYAKTASSVNPPADPTELGQFYYADKDGDGFGDNFSAVWVPKGVTAPMYFVLINTDCNDEDKNVNPGVAEISGDGIDNNCDGVIE